MKRLSWVSGLMALGALIVVLLLSAGAWDRAADLRQDVAASPAPPPEAIERGAYLAKVGHCAGCHTARGGAAYAGGRVIGTPFGAVVAANLTPDPQTGLGRWTGAAFRRALRDGRSADGSALLPACPYPNFSLVSDSDADDLWAYLQSLSPVRQAAAPHDLRFPYHLPAALVAWRALKFQPASLPSLPDEQARRGAYLVGGLGHCSACHGQRDRWGATAGAWDLRGGEIPQQGWLAPSLLDPREAGVAGWPAADVVALLKTGRSPQASVSGPMALVVAHSTQHYTDRDVQAVATYLRQLPPPSSSSVPDPAPAPSTNLQATGERLYDRHCADCHGKAGQGTADDGPPLAGNRAVALASPVNVTRMVLLGGFGPSTAAVPRPAGMPPFATLLSDEEIAAVVSFVRWRFGAQAGAVSALEVNRQR